MNILAIDTSGLRLHETSVSLKTEKGVFTRHALFDARQQSEILIYLIEAVLADAGISKSEISVALVGEGPGSFTGLRIAYSTGKALSLAIGARLVPIPTLACMAYSLYPYSGEVLAAIDAKRDAVYAQVFNKQKEVTPVYDRGLGECLSLLKATKPVCVYAGDSSKIKEKFQGFDEDGFVLIEYKNVFSQDMIKYFLVNQESLLEKKVDDYTAPLYVRKSDAEQ